MAKVFIVYSQRLAPGLTKSWSLWREGTGPGRCEGQGFKSKKEAEVFAKKYGHEIVGYR